MSARVGDTWYRYDAIPAFPADATVCLSEYKVSRVTEKGVWLDGWGTARFVNNSWRKKFAYTSKEEAMESFKIRKKREIEILERRLVTARAGLKRAESGDLNAHVDFDEFVSRQARL